MQGGDRAPPCGESQLVRIVQTSRNPDVERSTVSAAGPAAPPPRGPHHGRGRRDAGRARLRGPGRAAHPAGPPHRAGPRRARRCRAQRIGLDAANLRYNLLKLSVAVDDVQVRSEEWPDGPTFATIRHADADLSLRALLHGRYEVQSARIDGLDVHYVVDADGRTNLPSPPERESSSDAPLDYLIDDARITNAVVRYESRPQGLDLRLPVQQLTVRGNAATLRHDVQLAAAGGEVAASGRRVAIESARRARRPRARRSAHRPPAAGHRRGEGRPVGHHPGLQRADRRSRRAAPRRPRRGGARRRA